MANTRKLVAALTSIPGVSAVFEGAGFHEAVLRLPQPVAPLLEKLSQRDIFGGFDLSRHHSQLGHAVLVCATETKTDADIEAYRAALSELLSAR